MTETKDCGTKTVTGKSIIYEGPRKMTISGTTRKENNFQPVRWQSSLKRHYPTNLQQFTEVFSISYLSIENVNLTLLLGTKLTVDYLRE